MVGNKRRESGNVVVIGAGIAGLTAAYSLASKGQRVELIDAGDRVVSGCSFANAALLTPAMAYPLNSPGATWQLLRSFLPGDSALKIDLTASIRFIPWGLSFLRKANRRHFEYATAKNYLLALYSVQQTAALKRELGLKFDNSKSGSLKIFRKQSNLAAAQKNTNILDGESFVSELLDAADTCALEPTLSTIRDSIAGSIYYPQDQTGDPVMFAEQLAQEFQSLGGKIQFNTTVLRINTEYGAVTSIETSSGKVIADRIILATGYCVNDLLSDAGSRLPIAPLKGYTLTVEGDIGMFPSIPIVDADANIVVTPLGNRLRVSGFVELAGRDLRIPKKRMDTLVCGLKRILPNANGYLDEAKLNPWSGLRPVSADGLPFVGETSTRNLYVSVGHGHLGWTMAVGSGQLLAAKIMGMPCNIDASPYSPSRLQVHS